MTHPLKTKRATNAVLITNPFFIIYVLLFVYVLILNLYKYINNITFIIFRYCHIEKEGWTPLNCCLIDYEANLYNVGPLPVAD